MTSRGHLGVNESLLKVRQSFCWIDSSADAENWKGIAIDVVSKIGDRFFYKHLVDSCSRTVQSHLQIITDRYRKKDKFIQQ